MTVAAELVEMLAVATEQMCRKIAVMAIRRTVADIAIVEVGFASSLSCSLCWGVLLAG